jgi:hypothetical protein
MFKHPKISLVGERMQGTGSLEGKIPSDPPSGFGLPSIVQESAFLKLEAT